MRKIKFRGKRIDNGDWVVGGIAYLDYYDGENYIEGAWVTDRNNKSYEVNPDTVSQYTGLKDKSDNEIYEGDIVRADMDFGPGGMAEQIASIYWDEGVGGWQFNYFNKSTIEIIGNIYENPELLK